MAELALLTCSSQPICVFFFNFSTMFEAYWFFEVRLLITNCDNFFIILKIMIFWRKKKAKLFPNVIENSRHSFFTSIQIHTRRHFGIPIRKSSIVKSSKFDSLFFFSLTSVDHSGKATFFHCFVLSTFFLPFCHASLHTIVFRILAYHP